MFSKLVLITLASISFASIVHAQSTTTQLPKKKVRTTANSQEANYSPAISMKNSVVEVKTSANAAISQYAFQPKEGQVALTVTPEIKNLSVRSNFKKDRFEETNDTRSNILMLRAQRGLSNNWSWNASMGFGTQESDIERQKTSNSQGLTDIVLGAQKLREIPEGQLFYGGKISLSPSEREESYSFKNGKNGDGNLQTGGTTLSPYVGLQVDRRDYIFGAQAQFDYAFDRSSTRGTASGQKIIITRSNQHVLGLEGFFETPMPQFIFGAKAGIAHALESDTDARLGAQKEILGTDTYQVLNGGIYARIQANKTLEVLPTLSFSKLIGSNGGSLTVEDVNGISLGVAIRTAL